MNEKDRSQGVADIPEDDVPQLKDRKAQERKKMYIEEIRYAWQIFTCERGLASNAEEASHVTVGVKTLAHFLRSIGIVSIGPQHAMNLRKKKAEDHPLPASPEGYNSQMIAVANTTKIMLTYFIS